MKRIFVYAFAAVLLATAGFAEDQTVLKTETDRLSYSIGMNLGSGFKAQSIEVNTAVLMQGIKDAMSGGKALMTDDEIRASLTAFQSQLQAKQAANQEKMASENKAKGEGFLAENKKKEGVVTTASGLQYKIITPGTGPKPKETDTVVTHYKGTLIDGTEFDSSYKRNEPATFQVNQVIKGWTEALQLMPVGSKWMLFVPANLAYGDHGAAGVIGPNETLVFEVELLSIQEPAKQ